MDSSSSDEDNKTTFTSEVESEKETASLVCEEKNSESTETLVDHLKDLTAKSNLNDGTNKPMESESSSNNVKFLSSEFFDQFVCQPSTSKENPEIIRKADVENDLDLTEKLNSNTSGPDLSERNDSKGDNKTPSSNCKSRKNIGNSEEKRNDKKETNSNPQSVNQPHHGFGNSVPSFNFVQPEKKTYNSSEEYFSDLRLWLQQAFFWQGVTAAFPYFLMCQQLGQISNSSLNQQAPPGFNFPPQFPFPFSPLQGAGQQASQRVGPSVQTQQATTRQRVIDGVECRVPSFWKRIAAEFIDFMILFFVKIAVTYVAIDFFHLVDLDQLDILQKDSKLAYKQFIQITQEIFILELIHRLVVCVFETFWLQGGHNGQIGGATPGKSIMGLRVIHCESSAFIRESDGVIVVKPGTNLGLATAFFRSVAKNFVLALLVPTSFAFIFFPHNRTGYDMICSTIVVEDPIIPHRVND
ncbi:protein FAM8A1 [Halyomorpha halys]|uniref:protein FAM8A1 n=1 Tax=Halyomorpha halys TaxID=286706 RepID=UPI0006D4E595|nr:protein FAM8A1 [Halyomorpha halys]